MEEGHEFTARPRVTNKRDFKRHMILMSSYDGGAVAVRRNWHPYGGILPPFNGIV